MPISTHFYWCSAAALKQVSCLEPCGLAISFLCGFTTVYFHKLFISREEL